MKIYIFNFIDSVEEALRTLLKESSVDVPQAASRGVEAFRYRAAVVRSNRAVHMDDVQNRSNQKDTSS